MTNLDRTISIVLSGHICRPESASLKAFWSGFIELQKGLKSSVSVTSIYAHSWNPEYKDLVELVYGEITRQVHEPQPNFSSQFVGKLPSPDYYEAGIDRSTSTWKNVSLQNLLGNSASRSRAVSLLASDDSDSHANTNTNQVLITRWDLGQTGGISVNQLVYDDALPNEFLYLANYSELDEGYADMWVVLPYSQAVKFSSFYDFCVESLKGLNPYLINFTERGWPLSDRKGLIDRLTDYPMVSKIKRLADMCVIYFEAKSHIRLFRGLGVRGRRLLSYPRTSGEISCNPNPQQTTYPAYQALNIHALLKYFIIARDLRKHTRFLDVSDFQSKSDKPVLLNPISISLFIWVGGDFNQNVRQPIVSGQLCRQFFVCKETMKIVGCSVGYEQYVNTSLRRVFNSINEEFGVDHPCLFVTDPANGLIHADWHYLDALAKYMNYSKKPYVNFQESSLGVETSSFPELWSVRSGGQFSFDNSLCLIGFCINIFNELNSVTEIQRWLNLMNFEYLYVKNGERVLGRE